jgi:peroxiredoxin
MDIPGPKVGELVPDFELPASANQRVRLSEALRDGPVVLLVYVLDFSPG